uniref:Hypothetical secreted protein n=1 Tax=Glossina morsitans morsitans TaxID=37546 RepID=D3TRT9_GLOMM
MDTAAAVVVVVVVVVVIAVAVIVADVVDIAASEVIANIELSLLPPLSGNIDAIDNIEGVVLLINAFSLTVEVIAIVLRSNVVIESMIIFLLLLLLFTATDKVDISSLKLVVARMETTETQFDVKIERNYERNAELLRYFSLLVVCCAIVFSFFLFFKFNLINCNRSLHN